MIGEEPTAYLYRNGNALYFDQDGRQMTDLQALGWCGLRRFVAQYPDARISIQACERLEKQLVPLVLRHLRDTPADQRE